MFANPPSARRHFTMSLTANLLSPSRSKTIIVSVISVISSSVIADMLVDVKVTMCNKERTHIKWQYVKKVRMLLDTIGVCDTIQQCQQKYWSSRNWTLDRLHTITHTYTHLRTRTYTLIHTYTHTNLHTHTHLQTHTYTHTHRHAQIQKITST